MYHLDDAEKSDGESMGGNLVVIEEGGGGVGLAKPPKRPVSRQSTEGEKMDVELGDGDEDAEGEDEDKVDEYGWDDAYEQEV